MLIPNHPDDERLSALASQDDDAASDSSLAAHVTSCDRCTTLVAELGALRTSLAELPDLPPSRPLQFVPPVEDAVPVSDGIGGWARRFFAPALAAGFALVMAGTVGTALPALNGAASGPTTLSEGTPAVQELAPDGSTGPEPNAASDRVALGGAGESASGEGDTYAAAESSGAEASDAGSRDAGSDEGARLSTERSPWPMVLFAGVALIVVAGLMRWILVPRAG